MNVLNKIKSKKAKEPLRVTDEPPPPPLPPPPPSKPSPPKQQDSVPSSVRPSSNLFVQKREIVVPRWRAEEGDDDDATVSDYFSKKDKEKRSLLSRSEGSDQFREQDYKDFTCLNVKKGYSIGSICLFEGELMATRAGKEERRRMSVSCAIQSVSFPESIAKIILSRITLISEEEAVFVGEDIIKIIEKGHTKK